MLEMALQLHLLNYPSSSICVSLTPRVRNNSRMSFSNISGAASIDQTTVPKRSQHFQYKPTIWDYDFVQSLTSSFTGDEACMDKMEKVKGDVRIMLEKAVGSLAQLELIDVLERLGVGYLFEDEINRSLNNIYSHKDEFIHDSLYATALTFRIFRQHGFQVSQDVFMVYMDESGSFSESLCQDVKGMLSLYEASHLLTSGEKTLDDAVSFTREHLKDLKGKIEPNLAAQLTHSLEIPLHWRMERSEARWYIDAYQKQQDMNPSLLQFAKMDFNMHY